MTDNDELVQYIIVNKDLSMSAEKIAAQVGHVCTICAVEQVTNQNFVKWYSGSQKKIILQAHESVLRKLENEYFSIRDIGLTEIEPNSLTAVSLGVMTREQAKPLVKRLQLLK